VRNQTSRGDETLTRHGYPASRTLTLLGLDCEKHFDIIMAALFDGRFDNYSRPGV